MYNGKVIKKKLNGLSLSMIMMKFHTSRSLRSKSSVCREEESVCAEGRICVLRRKAVSSRQGSGDEEMVLTQLYRQRVTVRHCLWIASLPPNKKSTHRKWGRSVSLRHVMRGSMPRSGVTENCDVHNHQPCSASSLHKTDRSETLRPHFL